MNYEIEFIDRNYYHNYITLIANNEKHCLFKWEKLRNESGYFDEWKMQAIRPLMGYIPDSEIGALRIPGTMIPVEFRHELV